MTTGSGSTVLSQERVQQAAEHVTNGEAKVNNWSAPGRAAFDLRSKAFYLSETPMHMNTPLTLHATGDVMTTPTTRMLEAIAGTTLLDDVYQEDPTTNNLEAFCAELTGKEAGLLVLSGTMGNQVAIRAHLQGPPHSIVADRRSHVMIYEAGGLASLSGVMCYPATPSNGKYLTLEEVEKQVVLSNDIHACPTKLISLENTLNGVIMPLAEAQRISEWARSHGIIMHLDGARLWEAVAAGAGSLKEYSACFDTMSLCFSKGLGAPIGSIIVGTNAFRTRARWIRKMMGGGLRQAGVISAAARLAVEDTFLQGKLAASHARARHLAQMWEKHGGKLAYPADTNMVWVDLAASGISTEKFVDESTKVGLRVNGGRMVIHYQIEDEAVRRIERLIQVLFP